jgi:putative two-component system response regulator
MPVSGSRPGLVLVVEDELANARLLERLVGRAGHRTRIASDGQSALNILREFPADVILLDVQMPGLSGFDVCRILKENPATRLIPVILITGLHDQQSRIEGINAGADDFIAKPFDAEELRARIRSLLKIKYFTDELESAEAVIMSLALTVEARDAYTAGHCQRLAVYSTALGRQLGLSEDELAALTQGGYLHDIGKIAIPDAVLLKTGPLTAEEFTLMKEHTVIGERLCAGLRSLRLVRPIIRHHHERLDGSGYPDGLSGDAIPLLAQIISIADTFDAITTNRPYRRAAPAEEAFGVLRREVERGLQSAELVAAFIALGESGQLFKAMAE